MLDSERKQRVVFFAASKNHVYLMTSRETRFKVPTHFGWIRWT